MKNNKAPPDPESDSPIVEELRQKLGIGRYRDSTEKHAKEYLTRVLTETGGDRITAAAIAGLNRTHLQALIKRFKVEVKPNLKNRGRRRMKSIEQAKEILQRVSGSEQAEASEATVENDVDW
jgi:hypothetical protein